MSSLDAAALAQQVVKLGLATPSQLQECQEEAGDQKDDAGLLLRLLERKSYLSALQLDKLHKGDKDGYYLGGFRLLYKIASGSFGRVYRGDEPQTGRIVAVKVLRRRWSDKPDQLKLFEREAKVGMSLKHPNIVEILAVGQDASTKQHFIVMEFVEGGNLRDILAIRKKIEPPEAFKILEEMVAALMHAFGKGITHRDIKLTNILMSTQGVAKLVDFGLAQMYSMLGRHHQDEANVQRTVDYAGLEMATGVKSADIRSDIYFIGCVFYELLTGRPPLVLTRNRQERMQRQRFEKTPPIRPEEIDSPHTAAIIRLVETMMSLNAQQRFQTPGQLLDAVKTLRQQIGAAADNAVLVGKPMAPAAATVFLVERDPRLQEAIREKLKNLGYRVLIAADPARAVQRFGQQPFAGLIVDAGTTMKEGLEAFKGILQQAHDKRIPCKGVLILSEDQTDWAAKIDGHNSAAILHRPLKLGQLVEKVQELVPLK